MSSAFSSDCTPTDKNSVRSQPVVTRLADVEPQAVEWLWPGRVAIGKLTLLAGDPGLGKSFVTLDMASRVSRGAAWPDDSSASQPAGGVVLISAEDDLADTIRPRLDVHHADVSKIVALEAVTFSDALGNVRREVDLTTDLGHIECAIDAAGDCRLVVIDPVSAFLGGTDSHKNAEVRSVLARLSDLAEQKRVAVVAVTHLRKGEGAAIYRAMGSLAFVAAARAAWAVVKDQDDPQKRLLLPMKNNLAPDVDGLAYRIEASDWGDSPSVSIENAEESRYRISQETGIDPASLCRFVAGQTGLSNENIDRLGEYLGLEIVKQKGK